MLLDVGVGFSPPVGVLRHFVQSDVVNQEVGVGVRTQDAELSFCDFCNSHRTRHYRDFGRLLLLVLFALVAMQFWCHCYRIASAPQSQDKAPDFHEVLLRLPSKGSLSLSSSSSSRPLGPGKGS